MGYWQDCGMVGHGFSGATPLTNAEVVAWSQLSGVGLTPWEYKAIRDMSRAYTNALHAGDDVDTPPPYGASAVEHDKAVVSRKVSSFFSTLKEK